MTTPDSDISQEQQAVPLSGSKLDAAIRAMEAPGFLPRLTARIMKIAASKGFFSPFEDEDMDLPGGESVAGLANSIIEKTLSGNFTWDDTKHPDFYRFCCSRAESILSNWLLKNRRLATFSPLEEDLENGESNQNPVNQAAESLDAYQVLRLREGGKLGDRLLEDFALSLEKPVDQAIVMAVHDDRLCIERSYCRGKLGLSEADYDAAIKRIARAGKKFFVEWCRDNKVVGLDRQEAR